MKRIKKFIAIFVIANLTLLFLTLNCSAQQTNLAWVKALGGTASEGGESIAIDTAGNVYTAGYFNGTCDFNPGAATYNLTSVGSTDIFISKIDASGNFVWAKNIGGTSADRAYSIALDGSGNIYISGYFIGTADFNPGAGTDNLISVGSYDIFFAKYDNSGSYLWAYSIGSATVDLSENLAVDNAGNVYITGYFTGTADFNPGAGTNNLSSWGGNDIFFAKYSSSGTYIWAQSIGSLNNDQGYDIAVDGNSNVYLSGQLNGTADFNPGATTTNLTPVGAADIFFAKYSSSGAYIWAKNIGSSSSESAESMVVDAAGNVYISGYFLGTTDFDPGASVASLSSIGGADIFFAKYNTTGIYQWAKSIGSTNDDHGLGIALDGSNNVYVTGYFQGLANFDPLGTADLTPVGGLDIFYAKYDASGGYLWANNIGDVTGDDGNGIVVDGSGNVYITGDFKGSPDFDPKAGIFSLTSAGNFDIFVLKVSQCNVTVATTQTNITCHSGNDGIATAIVSGGTSPFTYAWSNTEITQSISNLTEGTYSVTVTDVNGCTGTASTIITEPLLSLSYFSSLTNASCNNNDGSAGISISGGIPPYSYLWSNSSTTQTISGVGSGTYTFTVTDDNGCEITDNIVINNSILPPAPSICMVTVDGTSTNNIVYWDKTSYTNADSFIVYREVSTSVYNRIGAVAVDSLSEYIDTARSVGPANGNPNVGSYRYKLQVLDTCGNYSSLGLYHNTIYIIDAGLGQFTWSIPYSIEGGANPVSNYVLLCDTANVDVWGPVGVVAGTQSSATDPGFANHSTIANWRVKTSWSIVCDPTRTTVNTSRSNIKHGSMTTGIISNTELNSAAIYPNPASDFVTIELARSIEKATVKIMNAIGQIEYEQNVVSTGNSIATIQINTSLFAKGIYTIAIESNGAKVFKKLVVN